MWSCLQRSVIDAVALVLGALCSLQPAQDHLTAKLPPQRFCVPRNFITLMANTLLAASVCGMSAWYLSIQPWFTKGTATGYKVLAASQRTECAEFARHVHCCLATFICAYSTTNSTGYFLVLSCRRCCYSTLQCTLRHYFAERTNSSCCREYAKAPI